MTEYYNEMYIREEKNKQRDEKQTTKNIHKLVSNVSNTSKEKYVVPRATFSCFNTFDAT